MNCTTMVFLKWNNVSTSTLRDTAASRFNFTSDGKEEAPTHYDTHFHSTGLPAFVAHAAFFSLVRFMHYFDFPQILLLEVDRNLL